MAATKKTIRKKEKHTRFSFFSALTPEQKSTIFKYAGLTVFALTLFTLVSTVSYLFTWESDQSLLAHPDMVDKNVEVANWGGKLGYRWSVFLVARCFGLGSMALVFLMGAVAYRLFFWNRHIGLLRTTFITVSGAFLSSLLLAYISSHFGADTCFGGGLGGDAGTAVIAWMSNLVGPIATALILVVLIVAWLILSNKKFAGWFALAGEKDEDTDLPVVDEDVAEDGMGTEMPDENMDAPEDEGSDQVAETGTEEPSGLPETPVDEPADASVDVPVDVPDAVVDVPDNKGIEVIRGENIITEVTEELPRFDNRQELERFEFPSLDLLKDYADGRHKVSQQELDINNNRIRATLLNYRIEVDRVTAIVGPTVTLYKIVPAPGVRVASIETVHREIAMALGVSGVRVVMLPDSVGIEVPNSNPTIVPLKAMLNSETFRNSTAELPIAIGYTITQEVKTFDLTDAPHLLVAGATKQGKSVGLNVIISSLLYAKHPSELKFVFIDPKMVEFTSYNSLLKHYLAVLPMAASEEEEKKNAIIKNPKQAEQVLNSLCIEMDERYNLLALAGVNDFKLYNEKYKDRYLLPTEGHKYLPYLVVVIDEYADLIMSGGANQEAKKAAKNIEASIIRLAQKGRAAGIHVIIATQRPSVNVITGLIKANFPTRIAFRVLSSTDSRTILDSNGAENLIGKGDMLYYAGVKMERVQCALVSMNEINKITKFIGDQNGWKQCYGTPYYLPVPESQDGESGGGSIDMQNIDPMFEDAARMVVTSQRGSTSDLQRRLGMGYARAGRVMDQLEAAGIVGPQEGSKPRQVLVSNIMELDEILSHFVN